VIQPAIVAKGYVVKLCCITYTGT